jgi:PAS domain S-box-containing protein
VKLSPLLTTCLDQKDISGLISNIADRAEDDIFIIDKTLTIIYMNAYAAKCFNFQQQDIIGKNFKELFPPDEYKIRKQNIMKVFRSKKPCTFISKITFPDKERWLNTRLVPFKNKNNKDLYLMGISRDITDQKQTEEAILRAKFEWQNAIDTIPDCIALINTDYRIIRVNKAMARYLGIPVQKAVGLTCYEHLNKSMKPHLGCPLVTHMVLTTSGPIFDDSNKLVVAQQNITASPLIDSEGNLMGCLHINRTRDITDIKGQVNQRKQIQDLLRNTQHIIFVQDTEGRYTFFDSIPKVGFSNGDFMGKTPFNIFRHAEASRIWKLTKQVIETGQEVKQFNQIEDIMSFEHISPIKNAVGDVISTMMVIRNIVESVKKDFTTSDCPAHNLTKRELEILGVIASGYSSRQIAEKLNISKTTVETHRARIMQKCNLHKTADLVQLAIKLGIN